VGKTPGLRLCGSICAGNILVTGCFRSVHSSSPNAALNEEVQVGSFAFTVTRVDIGSSKVGHQTAQGVFIVVDLTVRNIGDAPRTVYCQNQRLKALAGRTYDGGVNVGAGEDLINIKPGNKIRFSCAFDVQKGTLPAAVEVHDSPYFRGATVTVLEKG
jgi:hypothetical protein